MLTTEIKQLIQQQQLASIELDDCESTEITGFFLSVSDYLVVMQLIGNDGTTEGFTLFEPDLITELYWGNREHQCIQALAEQKSQITPVLFKANEFRDAVTELSCRYQSIALFSTSEGQRFEAAQIIEFDEEWLKLRCFGTLKTLSPMTKLLRFDQINRVEFGSAYLNDMSALHKGFFAKK